MITSKGRGFFKCVVVPLGVITICSLVIILGTSNSEPTPRIPQYENFEMVSHMTIGRVEFSEIQHKETGRKFLYTYQIDYPWQVQLELIPEK